MSKRIPVLFTLALSACAVPDEATDPVADTSTGTGEGGGPDLEFPGDSETGADDDGNDLTCATPGEVVEIEIEPGLCVDCTCGIHGVLVDCEPLFHPC